MNTLKQVLAELLADYLALAQDNRPDPWLYPAGMAAAYDRAVAQKKEKYEAIIKGAEDAD